MVEWCLTMAHWSVLGGLYAAAVAYAAGDLARRARKGGRSDG